MKTRLVYHSIQMRSGSASPFYEVIDEFFRNRRIDIACPYISITLLKNWTEGARRWRLVTDVEEWLQSQPAPDRWYIKAFILRHPENVRHMPALHAEVVIGEHAALIGSMNLTRMGLAHRDEMGILISDEETLWELVGWFDDLWTNSAPIQADELSRLTSEIACLQVGPARRETRLRSVTKPPAASIPAAPTDSQNEEHHRHMIASLRKAPSRKCIEGWLDLAERCIRTTGFGEADKRLVTTNPGKGHFTVQVGRRYVFYGKLMGNLISVGFIVPWFVQVPGNLEPSLVERYEFSSRFKKNEEPEPLFLTFTLDDPRSVPEEFLEIWENEVKRECQRCHMSPYQGSHRPLVYALAMDHAYRHAVLDEVFGERTPAE